MSDPAKSLTATWSDFRLQVTRKHRPLHARSFRLIIILRHFSYCENIQNLRWTIVDLRHFDLWRYSSLHRSNHFASTQPCPAFGEEGAALSNKTRWRSLFWYESWKVGVSLLLYFHNPTLNLTFSLRPRNINPVRSVLYLASPTY